MRILNALMSLVTLAMLSGCAESLPTDDGEFAGETEGALLTENALTENAITENALTENALTENALTENALTENALTENALGAVQAPNAQGALNRELLKYIVACALKPSQSFDFTWTDAADATHTEHYVGQLGLAPQWATGALGLDGERMVSACLAAKVNYYGVHVTISVRSGQDPLRLRPSLSELHDYNRIEGAFWGNIWAPEPYLNACYVSANVDNSRAHLRECATGHLNADGTIHECGIINIAGPCSKICSKYVSSQGYYEKCLDQPDVSKMRTDIVLTTALP